MPILVSLMLCLSATRIPTALAQPSDAIKAMTLAESLAFASAHQPEIKQALAELAARQSEARIPRSAWLPRAAAQAQWFVGTANNTTTNFVNTRGVDIPRVSSTPVTASTSYSPAPSSIVALNVQQQLYDFGRVAAQSALADSLSDVARARSAAVQLDVALRVEETYDAVLAAKHILAASQEAYRRAEAHFRLADTGVRSGMRPPIDRTRAQAELAQSDVQRTRAEASLTAARAALAAVIGSPDLQIDAVELQPGDRAFPGLDEALRIAEAHSPEILAALARLHADESMTRAISRELLPNLYLSGTIWGSAGGAAAGNGETPYGGGWLPSVGNYGLALVLEWRLLDPTTLARRSASHAREQVAAAPVEVARREIILQVQRAYLDLIAAQKTLPGLVLAVSASRANLDQAEARFRAGLGNIVELTEAEALLVNAQLEQAVGQFNVARAAARLARALGSS
jgi:outer membrane protein TolC